jgi:acyl-coenzyme A synthetase/AMP-(fatty) acid ligase/acyl carrier protein
VSYEVATDSRKLADYQQKHQIDVLKIVPSHLGALLNSEEAARVLPRRFLIMGGEALSWGLVDKIRATKPGCEIINHYGPTETTVGSLTLRLSEVPQLSVTDSATVPIGRPISNTRVYILDQHLAPVPVGVAGELYIGGDGVTAGYLNQPDKTAERFVPDPFSKNPNSRLYRTGDLARYLPDGHIEFLGRGDDQVKVRGFRIELGEVEAVLASQAGVMQVAVLAREEKDTGEKRLVAYLVTSRDNPPTTEGLRQKLREQLPDYMVPSAMVFLDKLPLNANGKVDRKALPAPEEVQEQARAYVAPRTPIEEVVANIWAEVLHREQVGAEDNFFDLGGHSLLATQIVSRVREHFSIDLALRSLFEAPTVAGLAELVKAAQESGDSATESPAIVPVSREAYRVTRSTS